MFGNKNAVQGESASAVIMDVQNTSMYMNQLPFVKITLAVFPDNGPMEIAEFKQTVSFVDLPKMVPGAGVYVSIERDKKGAMKRLMSIQPNPVLWEGDPEVVDAVKALLERITDCKLIHVEGIILSSEETQAKISSVPIFKYHVRFNTEGGETIEGDTYQAARPWLRQYRQEHPDVMVQYSAVRSTDFGLVKQ
jgi:hypothetical protein